MQCHLEQGQPEMCVGVACLILLKATIRIKTSLQERTEKGGEVSSKDSKIGMGLNR
jgi:hypothetical protein